MLNLLFISNSPKMDFIKKNLQPLLKVKIDVVNDFDHGLKDVFEKRPATIIIQEQISGVTGESVARHIQMLLGSGAPIFVLMHEGNARIKPIKGLFEYIVDLTQPDANLVEDVLTILKSILGPEWEKTHITPKQDAAALVASFAMSDDSRMDADQLIDDFITALETNGKYGQEEVSPQSFGKFDQLGDVPQKVESSADELAHLLVESAQQASDHDIFSLDNQTSQNIEPATPKAAIDSKQKDKAAKPSTRKAPSKVDLSEKVPLPEAPVTTLETKQTAESEKSDHQVFVEPKAPITISPKPAVAEVTPHTEGGELNSVPPSPADFRIIPSSPAINEQIPEDLLLAFEENYNSQASTWKRLTIVIFMVICLVAAGWLLIKQKPGLFSFITKIKTSQTTSAPSPVKPAAIPDVKPSIVPQKPISTARKSVSALPSFMSTASRDSAFSAQKPGWERYVGKVYEYRIFRSGDNIKVVQVLAGIGTQTVDEKFLKTVLKEFVGNVAYVVSSREQKQDYQVQHGSVDKKADLLIYRSKKTGGIRAFVVSLN